MTLADISSELRTITASFSEELLATGSDAVARRPAAGKWSPKEVLGHLVDSAANNHQRFVRAQQGDALTLPTVGAACDPPSHSWTSKMVSAARYR